MSLPAAARAVATDRSRVIGTVVAAFRADPAFRYFFPDDAHYREQATAFVERLFDRRVTGGTVWVIDGGAAVSMWDGPGPPKPVGPEPAQPEPEPFPVAVVERMAIYHDAVGGALPKTPHWYLGVLATHPDHAGQGWGRAAMAAGLRAAAADGLPAYLETANAGNVELYRRAGWEMARSLTVERLPIWVMVHR